MSHSLYSLLQQLETARVPFAIARHRPDSVLVTITFVGERIEVDVFEDGHMEVSRFIGSEKVIGGADLVSKIISDNAEPAA